MAEARSKQRREGKTRAIGTNWEVIRHYPFRLEGDWLVADSAAAQVERSGRYLDRGQRLHRQLAAAVERRRGEVVLRENWRQMALAFANTFFPPAVDVFCSDHYRVSVARFGEEALLMWWMLRLRMQLMRGPQWGDLEGALQAAVQVWALAGERDPRLLPFRKVVPYDARAWIGVFGSTLPRPSQPVGRGNQSPFEFRPVDRKPGAVRSLSSHESGEIVRSLRAHYEKRWQKALRETDRKDRARAVQVLRRQVEAQYGAGSMDRLMLAGRLPKDSGLLSLDELNSFIRRESKRLIPKHRGVFRIGSPLDPEWQLWDLAADVFASTINTRMAGSFLACQLPPFFVGAVPLIPRLYFLTPLARIWFDFWKELNSTVDVRCCEVCGELFAATKCTQRFCSVRCRKTAEVRRSRTRDKARISSRARSPAVGQVTRRHA